MLLGEIFHANCQAVSINGLKVAPEIIVGSHDTFDNNIGIKNDFT